MQLRSVTGSEILLVEDEPLIAMEVRTALERAGAMVHYAQDVEPALRMADYPSLSAGIIDLRLGSGSAECVCEKLAARSVPFLFYTGAPPELSERFATVPVIAKTRNVVRHCRRPFVRALCRAARHRRAARWGW